MQWCGSLACRHQAALAKVIAICCYGYIACSGAHRRVGGLFTYLAAQSVINVSVVSEEKDIWPSRRRRRRVQGKEEKNRLAWVLIRLLVALSHEQPIYCQVGEFNMLSTSICIYLLCQCVCWNFQENKLAFIFLFLGELLFCRCCCRRPILNFQVGGSSFSSE